LGTLRYLKDWGRCAIGKIGNAALLERLGTLRYWKDWKRCAIGEIGSLHEIFDALNITEDEELARRMDRNSVGY